MTGININDLVKLQIPEINALNKIEKQLRPSSAVLELLKQSEDATRYLQKFNSIFEGNTRQIQAMANAFAELQLNSGLSRLSEEMNKHTQQAAKLAKMIEGVQIDRRLERIANEISTKINFPEFSFKIADFAKTQNIAIESLKSISLPMAFTEELERLRNIPGIGGLKQELVNSGVSIETVDSILDSAVYVPDMDEEYPLSETDAARKAHKTITIIMIIISVYRVFAADIKKNSVSGILITYAITEFLDYILEDERTYSPQNIIEEQNEEEPTINNKKELDTTGILDI